MIEYRDESDKPSIHDKIEEWRLEPIWMGAYEIEKGESTYDKMAKEGQFLENIGLPRDATPEMVKNQIEKGMAQIMEDGFDDLHLPPNSTREAVFNAIRSQEEFVEGELKLVAKDDAACVFRYFELTNQEIPDELLALIKKDLDLPEDAPEKAVKVYVHKILENLRFQGNATHIILDPFSTEEQLNEAILNDEGYTMYSEGFDPVKIYTNEIDEEDEDEDEIDYGDLSN